MFNDLTANIAMVCRNVPNDYGDKLIRPSTNIQSFINPKTVVRGHLFYLHRVHKINAYRKGLSVKLSYDILCNLVFDLLECHIP
jgi:hypothetical protein